jgi:predicted MPP superfamily phosphohydrolase
MLWFLLPVVLVIVYATLVERFWFAIRRESLAILPAGSKDIKILHISDIHMAPWQRRKQRWISKLAEQDIDLVINTGDNLGHAKAIPAVLASLNGLTKLPGVYVNGSNDLFAPSVRNPFKYFSAPSKKHNDGHVRLDTESLTSGFSKAGWLDLNNKTAVLEINGQKITFVGTDDAHEQLANISNLEVKSQGFVIGVTHAPYLKVLEDLEEKNAEIIFAGHTHGGQVCWPITGRALVTNCDLPTKYARGLAKLKLSSGKSVWLNVCAGLGHSIYAPIRFACRPEVRLLTLKAKS